MRVLFLIAARGGSKGIPGKNLQKIEGISLVGYKAISARKSKYCRRLIISTDSPEIQADAQQYGVEAPFTRPTNLATDTATTTDVIGHAMSWIEQESKEQYDAVMLLEPTSPFARATDYDNAVELMVEQKANAVVGVRQTEVSSTFVGPLDQQGRLTQIVKQMAEAKARRRQDLRPEFTPNGALYLFKWEYFKRYQDIYHDAEKTFGYPMDRLHSVEIDEPIDLYWAQFLVQNSLVDLSDWQ